MIANYACRLSAVALFYLALLVAVAAWREQHEVIAAVSWGMVVVLVSAGAALWKGSDV